MTTVGSLPYVERVVVVVAHPDDESFGLGAILSTFTDSGAALAVVCFTRGEASTLGASGVDLAVVRERELRDAATVLGVESVVLLDYRDGRLDQTPVRELVGHVDAHAAGADLVVAFDDNGVTGHPDHRRATEAAVAWAQTANVAVLAWTLPIDIADALNTELGVGFIGRPQALIDIELRVDRTLQRRAIECHHSQADGNNVLWRRLEMQRDDESLRYLSHPKP